MKHKPGRRLDRREIGHVRVDTFAAVGVSLCPLALIELVGWMRGGR